MTSGAPWSVKGIDPKAREVAKDLARRSGMTLGEWLNRMILDDEGPDEVTSQDQFADSSSRRHLDNLRGGVARAPLGASDEDAARTTAAIERLTARMEDAETRMGLAITGVEHSVREALARIEAGEREQSAAALRIGGALDDLKTANSKISERLGRVESEPARARSVEALSGLEQALTRVAGQIAARESAVAEREAAARGMVEDVVERVARLEAREPVDVPHLADTVAGRLGERLAEAEARTSGALEGLRASFAALDSRLGAVERDVEGAPLRLEDLAASLSMKVDAVRGEMADRLVASADPRVDGLEARLGEMAGHVEAAEQRSAQAIEQMGEQFRSLTEALTRRVDGAEQRSAEAMDHVGAEVSRAAGAIDARLGRAETAQAEALERLSGEIARITESLGERIGAAERRSALAIDEVGEQVVRVTDRLSQRNERASQELSDRIRQSEERTQRLLDEARERIDQQLSEARRQAAVQSLQAPEPEPARHNFTGTFGTSPTFGASFAGAGPAEPDHGPRVTAPPTPLGAFPVAEAASKEPAFEVEDFEVADFEPAAAFAPPAGFPPERGFADDDAPAPAPQAKSPFDIAAFDDEPEFDDDPVFEPAQAPRPRALSEAAEPAEALFAPEPEADAETLFEPEAPRAQASHGAQDPWDLSDEVEEAEADAFPKSSFAEPAFEKAALDEPTHDPFDIHAEDEEPVELTAGFEPADHDQEPTPELPARLLFDDPEPAADASARPLSTREIIEQARAAARANSASSSDRKAEAGKKGLKAGASSKPALGGLFSGLGRGRGKRRQTTLQTALLIAGGAAFLSVGAAGLVVMSAKPGGAPPKRVADAIERDDEGAQPAESAPVGANPRAAIALSPQLLGPGRPVAATAVSQDVIDAYQDGVRSLEAGETTGLDAVRKAANLGYAPAQRFLAKVSETGSHGVKADMGAARKWMERAAQGGDRGAMHDVALYYIRGVGGPKDVDNAALWFRRAADLGLVDSQYNLGVLYEKGIGVRQNIAESYKWFLVAARSGDLEARQSAQRVRAGLSSDAQAIAERAAAGYRASVAGASTTTAADSTATAQQALSRLGFYQGPRDGRPSPALNLAVAAYQREQGLPPTGALDQVTMSRLVVFTR
jgi:localization factor PodJL